MAVDTTLFDPPNKVDKNLFDTPKVDINLFNDSKVDTTLFDEEKKGTPLQTLGKEIFRYQIEAPGAALLGDIPFVGKEFRDFKPRGGREKFQFGATRFARDIVGLGKLAPLKGAKFLAGAGLFGAATAGSEDPKEIAKEAAVTAGTFKLFDIGARFIPKGLTAAYKKLPIAVQNRFANVGQSIGTSLKKIPKIDVLKFRRHSEIFNAHQTGEIFAKSLEKDLTKPERMALVFMREKTGIPKKLANAKEIEAAIADPNRREILKHYSKEIGNRYDDWHRELMKTYGDDIGFVENYINRLWDVPRGRKKEITNWFMTRPKHLKQRFIGTIQDGMEKGLKPKELDAARLWRQYNNSVATSIANMNLLKGRKMLDPKTGNIVRTPGLLDYRTADGIKAIQRIDKAPSEWTTTLDHPVLRRAMGFKNKKGATIISKVPVKVHPEIAEEMKTLFGQGIQGDFVRALEGVNAYAKHSQLALSLFHHVALGEVALASGSLSPKLMGKVIKDMKAGRSPVLYDDLSKPWAKAGVELRAPSDVHRNAVESSLLSAEESIKRMFGGKILSKGVAGVRKAIEANNRFLWDYLQPNFKIYTAEKLYQDALKSPKWANKPVNLVRQEIAQVVNDLFGGQNMVMMTRSPKWQQTMHWALLSPDWNLSTIRQAMSPFQVGARDPLTAELRAEIGQEFWKASGVILWASINNLNRAFSQFYMGEPRDMWDNDPEHKTHLFIGFNEDGSKRWLRWGKQFRELPEFFMNPIKKTAGKLSPVVQAVRAQTDPFQFGPLAKAKGTPREPVERVKQLGKTFVPFSVQNQVRKSQFSPIQFAFPTSGSRGGVYYNSLRQFKEALRNNDMKKVKEIHRAALENGVNSEAILRRAAGDLEYERTKAKKRADDVFFELMSIPRDQWQAHIAAQDLDDKSLKRLRRIVKERLKSEALLENINKHGASEQRLKAIIER